MINQDFYCTKHGNTYIGFHSSMNAKCLWANSDEKIYKVELTETEENSDDIYHGIYVFNDKKYKFIWKNILGTKICSPDYFESAVERKEVKFVRLKIINEEIAYEKGRD